MDLQAVLDLYGTHTIVTASQAKEFLGWRRPSWDRYPAKQLAAEVITAWCRSLVDADEGREAFRQLRLKKANKLHPELWAAAALCEARNGDAKRGLGLLTISRSYTGDDRLKELTQWVKADPAAAELASRNPFAGFVAAPAGGRAARGARRPLQARATNTNADPEVKDPEARKQMAAVANEMDLKLSLARRRRKRGSAQSSLPSLGASALGASTAGPLTPVREVSEHSSDQSSQDCSDPSEAAATTGVARVAAPSDCVPPADTTMGSISFAPLGQRRGRAQDDTAPGDFDATATTLPDRHAGQAAEGCVGGPEVLVQDGGDPLGSPTIVFKPRSVQLLDAPASAPGTQPAEGSEATTMPAARLASALAQVADAQPPTPHEAVEEKQEEEEEETVAPAAASPVAARGKAASPGTSAQRSARNRQRRSPTTAAAAAAATAAAAAAAATTPAPAAAEPPTAPPPRAASPVAPAATASGSASATASAGAGTGAGVGEALGQAALGDSALAQLLRQPDRRTIVVNKSPYLSLGLLGKGGSSKVFRVIGPDLKQYALKRVKLDRVDREMIANFTNEIALLQRLRGHRHIISLREAEVDVRSRLIYVVMELGETDLAHLVTKEKAAAREARCALGDDGRPPSAAEQKAAVAAAAAAGGCHARQGGGRLLPSGLDENFVRLVWQQMLIAVRTIHDARIVHGDLKPANFVLVGGCLKLIDFGIAKAISADTTNIYRENQVGTVNYMAPETLMSDSGRRGGGRRRRRQKSGAPVTRMGRASDVWSLGCILYLLVYGSTPFQAISPIIRKLKAITDPHHLIDFRKLDRPMPPRRSKGAAAQDEDEDDDDDENYYDEENEDVPPIVDVMRSCLQFQANDRPTIDGLDGLLAHAFLRPPWQASGAPAAIASPEPTRSRKAAGGSKRASSSMLVTPEPLQSAGRRKPRAKRRTSEDEGSQAHPAE